MVSPLALFYLSYQKRTMFCYAVVKIEATLLVHKCSKPKDKRSKIIEYNGKSVV